MYIKDFSDINHFIYIDEKTGRKKIKNLVYLNDFCSFDHNFPKKDYDETCVTYEVFLKEFNRLTGVKKPYTRKEYQKIKDFLDLKKKISILNENLNLNEEK